MLDEIVDALEAGDAPSLRRHLAAALDTEVRALLLYGSRARGEAHADSDWDVLAVTREARPYGIRRATARADLDIDARTVDELASPAAWVYLLPGRVLDDPEGILAELLARLEACRADGPAPLEEAERARWEAWLQRMSRRIAGNLQDDPVLAAYQMSWLHEELLTLYFRWRTMWTRGPRPALRWLREHDAETYAGFAAVAAASTPTERAEALRLLVERIAP